MDWRIVVVLLPVILAASWAGFNIFRAALGQINEFLSRQQ
ncbi:MAG: photosystem II protein Y [Leptolyngbyaceae bacterium]|nr:photosystem II protein Y [Leptolyngbyaceae bacterium]